MHLTLDDATSLLDSWLLHLRAERKSDNTLKAYGDGVRVFLARCEQTAAAPMLDQPTVKAFVADLLDAGAEAATARSRQFAVRRFSRWLAEDVVPSLRQTGRYEVVTAYEIPKTLPEVLRAYAAEVGAREVAEARAAELEEPAEAWNVLPFGPAQLRGLGL